MDLTVRGAHYAKINQKIRKADYDYVITFFSGHGAEAVSGTISENNRENRERLRFWTDLTPTTPGLMLGIFTRGMTLPQHLPSVETAVIGTPIVICAPYGVYHISERFWERVYRQ